MPRSRAELEAVKRTVGLRKEGLRLEDIAAIEGVTDGAIQQRLTRAPASLDATFDLFSLPHPDLVHELIVARGDEAYSRQRAEAARGKLLDLSRASSSGRGRAAQSSS